MSPPNGRANSSGSSHLDTTQPALPVALLGTGTPPQFTPEQINEFVGLLEVPFDASVVEWRVTNTSKRGGTLRGQVIPYADQRAYTDRLNALFTPAGWTRKYTVHTSANFQRSEDEKLVAKVFVTCDLTIFGLGSHSATGEEWTDDDNAGTSAEAQAFKRACSCFGLGRYLYYFSGMWIDLDERKRPMTRPVLIGWATPEGWREGLRPQLAGNQSSNTVRTAKSAKESQVRGKGNVIEGGHDELIRQVEAMADPLGKGLYRGLLKTVARAWRPSEIHDISVLQKLLAQMQSADRGLRRLEVALEQTGPEPLNAILGSLSLNSLNSINTLEALHEIVLALESKVR
jgi:hypothetical protein